MMRGSVRKWMAVLVWLVPALAVGEMIHAPAVEGEDGNQIGDQYYRASVPGVESLMKDLARVDRKSHDALRPQLERLREKENGAVVASAGLLGVGAFLTIGSVSFLQLKKRNDAGGSYRGVNTPAATVGVGAIVTSLFSYFLLMPDEGDYVDFVNAHNVVRPDAPVKFEWGGIRF